MAVPFNQWSSAVPFFQTSTTGLTEADSNRVRAYELYEMMYWNHPETFKLLQRGEDSNPIYLPSARGIIESTNRFLAIDFDYVVNPGIGTPEDRASLTALMRQLFRREQMYTKFATQRRFGLIWGDVIWHVTADPAKLPGSRISIHEVHPSRYFPIKDGPRTIGCHLVDETADPRDITKKVNRRQTYRKTETGTITTELALFEPGKWDDRALEVKPEDVKMVKQLVPVTDLPPQITSLPVYHIKNQITPGTDFGSSEIRGIETVLMAANQAVTDQDLALAMAGLGVYWTDAAPPADEAGEETDWEIGPARVAEVPLGRQLGRLQGISSVQPSLDHINFVLGEAQHGVGVPDIAAGKVDVTIAESGISLRLQLSPLLAKNAEKEQEMLSIYDHMLYDISTAWMAAYEAFATGAQCEISSVVGDPLPVNREAVIKEVMDLYNAGLITIEQAQGRLTEVGYDFAEDAPQLILDRQRALAEAKSFDPFTNRYNSEIENAEGEPASGAITS